MTKPYGYIYLITHLESGRYYVGQTTVSPRSRWNNHVADANKRAVCTIDRAIQKYGKNSFAFDVVSMANNQHDLDSMEAIWIIALGSRQRGIGFNIRHGGSGGGKLSEETKTKLREARSRQVMTPEMFAKSGMSRRGQQKSDEARRNMSAAQKGRTFSEETKRRMSEAKKRYLSSPENLANFIKRLPAHGTPYVMSEQGKKNISIGRRKWVAENPQRASDHGKRIHPDMKRLWAEMSPEEKQIRLAPMQAKRWSAGGI